MDEVASTRITNVIVTKHELTKEQRFEIIFRLVKVAQEFADKVDKENDEQLYRVKSPLGGTLIVCKNLETNEYFNGASIEVGGKFQFAFNQDELDEMQSELPGLNVKVLRVKV